MLTERQELVLRKVVEEYLEAGAPVGSKVLSAGVDWGPSTIRHELACLEELGLLAHPHTSAGRMPTDKGYRLYVNDLMSRERVSDAERKAVARSLAEVVTPEDYAGTIMGDLSSRRGRIEGMEHRAGSQVIKAIVPLAEMFGYATHMRSSTQGRAEYSMHFARYEEAPRSVAEEIIAKVQGTAK